MVTAKKQVVKDEPTYKMPVEVSNWIENAESRLSYLKTQVDTLKAENAGLRKANKVMEARVMGNSQE